MLQKDRLNAPYTHQEWCNFLDKNQRDLGYQIIIKEDCAIAMGYTDEELEEQQKELIDKLTMTALDFIKALRNLGLSLEQIEAVIESNIEIRTQLKYCKDVYCGIVKQFLPIKVGEIEITEDMVEQAFINKSKEVN